jgi:Flp pilus assembly protein TadD
MLWQSFGRHVSVAGVKDAEGVSIPAVLSSMKKHAASLVAIALLMLMASLMATPIKQESATVDESVYLVAGYSYWHGYGFTIEPTHPPLAKIISAAPLLFMDVKLSKRTQELLNRRVGAGVARDNWSSWPDVGPVGQEFVYGGANDADKILAAGRWMQVALTMLTGIVIHFWLRRLAGAMAGILGVALWALNPVTLAYGHLVLTDMGVTLMFVLAVWYFSIFLDRPSTGYAILCGLACGGALVMKFSAVLLAPILLTLLGLQAILKREWRGLGKYACVMAAAAGAVVLLVYAPFWSPAPPLPADIATKIGVPTWFQVLRPILIPPDFFKGLALLAGHESAGHWAFLCGQWRSTGWWYYFPVTIAVKTPLPLLLLTIVGLVMWLRGLRRFSFQHAIPWVAALMYLVFAIIGNINIGVRHLLPMFALLAVGTALQLSLRSRRVQLSGWLCTGWLLVVTWRAYPYFIEYFNEVAGGSSNGYQWLVDSNLDWGQDVKRLKHFLDEQAMTNIDLAYFGPGGPIDYYGITGRRVTSGEAEGMHSGTLVVSATEFMSPGWDWLRASHEPVTRIGYTMFVYHLGDAETKERWEQMLRIDPSDARAHYNLGIVLERAGDAEGAITHYEQAIRIKPDFAMPHFDLAIALQRAGKVMDAIEEYEQVLRLKPGLAEPEAHNDLGNALERTGKFEEAIAHYERALWMKPDYAEAHNGLGTALYQTSRREEAIAHYEQALRIDPDFAEAHNNLGNVFLQEGKFSEAVGHYEQALRIKPDYVDAHFNLGLSLENLGRTPEAVEQYEQTLKLRPDFNPARSALTRLGVGL